jgi:hypothetical protein
MENAAINKMISDSAIFFLFPFLMMVGHLSGGWNQESIKQDDKVVLEYQVYLPESKAQEEKKTVPVVIILKDKGGKLSTNEIKLVEARSKELGQAVVIPKSPGKDWVTADSPLISKLMADLTTKRALNMNQVELVSLNSGTPVAVKLLCTTQIRFHKVYLIGSQGPLNDCENGVVQKNVVVNQEDHKNIWIQKSQTLQTISAQTLKEILNLKPEND